MADSPDTTAVVERLLQPPPPPPPSSPGERRTSTVERSALLDRAAAFLPQMRRANAELERQVDAGEDVKVEQQGETAEEVASASERGVNSRHTSGCSGEASDSEHDKGGATTAAAERRGAPRQHIAFTLLYDRNEGELVPGEVVNTEQPQQQRAESSAETAPLIEEVRSVPAPTTTTDETARDAHHRHHHDDDGGGGSSSSSS